jgi:hypothetical protein
MPERRGAGRRVAGILGCVAIVVGAIIGVRYGFFGAKRGGPSSTHSANAEFSEKTPLAELAEAARNSDPGVFAEIQRRLATPSDVPPPALTEDEAKSWLQVLTGLRTGFLGHKMSGRIVSVGAACRIFHRFATEPAPSQWTNTLRPQFDLLSAALSDSDPNLRAAALDEVGRLWVWLPGRSMMPAEENELARWKEGLYRPVVRCLGNRDTRTLVAAIACLGKLPIDDAVAPALAYLDNPDRDVRKQTIASFALRPQVLTDDMLLSRLHDPDTLIRSTVHDTLKARGLSQEQISLGALMFSPKPQQRLSVIPLLKDHNDLDPAIWLIHLSRDSEEMVRLSAVEAMGALPSPSVRKRLEEMARSDISEAVRKAAGKLTPPARENTASLPSLPGSANLNPKAN